MSSGLTHIMLTKGMQRELQDGELKNILAACRDSFQVGSVAPDLPYFSIALKKAAIGKLSLADRFHYEKTNQIPLEALKMLTVLKHDMSEKLLHQTFSFFLGYISHVLADGIIHPFVRDQVGNYEENKAEHRSLEMQLDVLFLEERTSGTGLAVELNYTELQDEIKNFFEIENVTKIIQIFSDLIKNVYGELYYEKKIRGWINGLYMLLEVAVGDHPRLYRKLEENTFTFKNIEDIDRNRALILTRPKDRELNFLHVDEVDYFRDCIPQFYTRFTEVAQKAYLYVFKDGEELDESDIPQINLDTGRLIAANNLDLIPEFWKNT